jgi:hypothetical protein
MDKPATESREQRSGEETMRRVRELFARRGIEYAEPTPEQQAEVDRRLAEADRSRAREKLDEAHAKWTPERRRALREQLGLPTETA